MSLTDVAYLASEQAGLFTTAQAADLGVDRSTLHRSVRDGALRSPRRGVYVFASTPLAVEEELRAAWLSLDPAHTVAQRLQKPVEIVVCTTSAAAHYGIGDFDTAQHEFYTARRKQTRADDIRLRIRTLDAGDVEILNGLVLTTPTRIVLDLLAEGFDLGHISRLIADAVRQGRHVDWARIAEQAPEHAADYGLSPAGLFTALAGASESPSDTARTTLSMITSHPELRRDLHTQLAESLEAIGTVMLPSSLTKTSDRVGRNRAQSPALQALQTRQAQRTATVAAHRPAGMLPSITPLLGLDAFEGGQRQSRDTGMHSGNDD